MDRVSYRRVTIDGNEIFYREAGEPEKPTLLLLHGFPAQAICFVTSCRCSPVDSISWLPTSRDSASQTCRPDPVSPIASTTFQESSTGSFIRDLALLMDQLGK